MAAAAGPEAFPRGNLLPGETLCAIFAHLPFADLICVTHVCRFWRESALAFPALLWSSIESRSIVPAALDALLNRAERVPVQLSVTFSAELVDSTLESIVRHLYHTRGLSLAWDPDALDDATDTRLNSALAQDVDVGSILARLESRAPLLESLILELFAPDDDMDSDDPSNVVLPTDLFRGHAPRLRIVSLGCDLRIPRACDAMRSVTHLRYDSTILPTSCLLNLDVVFPSLQFFKVQVEVCNAVPDGSRSSLKLRLFDLDCDKFSPSIVHYFDLYTVPCVVLDDYQGWYDQLQGDRLPVRLDVGRQLSTATRCKMVDGVGRSLTVKWESSRIYLEASVLQNVRVLTVMEACFTQHHLLHCLPQLERLCVFATDYSEWWYHDFRAPNWAAFPGVFHSFSGRRTAMAAISCPNLQILDIAVKPSISPYPSSSLALPPEGVLAFIDRHLRFNATKLERLEFHGVELLTAVPMELGRLFDFVDTICVEPTCLPDPFDCGVDWNPLAKS
ncbi:hypothetical protein EXIGLDRAFT_844591 [Exidia glandulosa HHB12029]|uniref:F-box domain-containing protein n=1 Tax=Exidia glandulosa HHB12029 TaxID=1314781 RepID=A0A165BY56_EXIGL|nr:hypothetical protein EXIGLDRAFT_844591 [Exidia glandulosa HHB12029]